MLNKKDIEGMTLAELRALNARLDTEQATEQEALRTEYLNLQSEHKTLRENHELEWEQRRQEITDAYYNDIDDIDDEYKSYGVKIGRLTDTRRNTTEPAALQTIEDQIVGIMQVRKELKKKRRERSAQYRADIAAFKKQIVTDRHTLYVELSGEEQRLRKERLAIKKKFDEARELTRYEINKRLAAERAVAE